ncbi:MAG: putative ATPase [Rickettsiales bacterium]|jgi:putative ATPase
MAVFIFCIVSFEEINSINEYNHNKEILKMSNLFIKNKYQPLADALRPDSFADVVGQDHLFGNEGILARIEKSDKIPSLILWGSAGCGKTTIAKIVAKNSKLPSQIISATNSGVADLRKLFEVAIKRKEDGLATVLIVDEIHRFNRAQQDLFLPLIENGTIILIAATTENPSFELNSALLSRSRIVEFKALDEYAMKTLIQKAEKHLDKKLSINDEAKDHLIAMAAGDGRYFLNMCEELFGFFFEEKDGQEIDKEILLKLVAKRSAVYDKNRDGHYNLISALHKSMRGSDADAALYYLARMLSAGENPHYLLRRIVRFASEDIGMADPQALVQALAAKDSYDFLGSPEGDYAIANAAIYCATAPKSNSCYIAYKAAVVDAKNFNSLMPPKHILNSPTKMMKDLDYGKDYIYDHDTKNTFSGQEYFPDQMLEKKSRPKYYSPNERGFEREIVKRLDYWQKLKNN